MVIISSEANAYHKRNETKDLGKEYCFPFEAVLEIGNDDMGGKL